MAKQYLKAILYSGFWLVAGTCVTTNLQAQQLTFEKTTIDVGTLTEDDSAKTYIFPYKNMTNEPICITKAETTCGCTQPRFKHEAIAPGENGEIGITFYPLGRVGEMRRSVYLYTDKHKEKPSIKLTLTGTVLPSSDPYIDFPYSIGPLRLMQAAVNFRNIRGSRKQMVKIQVVNAGNRPLKLTTMGLPAFIKFFTSPATIPANEKADLLFVINPQACKTKDSIDCEFFLNGVGDINPLQRTMKVIGNVE